MSKSTPDLIVEYRLHAAKHGNATSTGDSQAANQHHDALMEALSALRERGSEGSDALLGLLADRDQSVRCWAATHCLLIDEARAKGVLKDLAAGPGIVAFDAQMVLSEWDKGRLRS